MSTINISSIQMSEFSREIGEELKTQKTLDLAAQLFTKQVYEKFKDSIVLSRLFATIPYSQLADYQKKYVNNLTDSLGVRNELTDDTLILTLLGTSGVENNWNSFETSKGHVGIPLLSSSFVEDIPMIARLMKQLGIGLNWIDTKDSNVLQSMFSAGKGGVFYVGNAAEEIDEKGRKIIAAQDFVKKYNIQTVFGIGASYLGISTLVVSINFFKETIDRSTADLFIFLLNSFKISTHEMTRSKHLFS